MIGLVLFTGCSENNNPDLKKQVQAYFDMQVFEPDWKTIVFQIPNDTIVVIGDKQTAYIRGTDKCDSGAGFISCVEIAPTSTKKNVSFTLIPTGEEIHETLLIERTERMFIARRPNGFPIHKKQ